MHAQEQFRRGIERIRGSFLSHLITIIRAVITTISMVIKKIAIRLVSARPSDPV